jgi:hypothetical protein
MVNPTFAEKTVRDLVQTHKSVTVKYLKNRTGFKKSVINAILHKNRHYAKTLRNPHGNNTRPIWTLQKIHVHDEVDFSVDVE